LEPAKDALRYRLVGPKVQVTKVEKGTQGMRIYMKMDTVTMIWDAPIPKADVRVGDLLTLYTEVLVNAEPSSTSVQ
jgi:hypothetical protein